MAADRRVEIGRISLKLFWCSQYRHHGRSNETISKHLFSVYQICQILIKTFEENICPTNMAWRIQVLESISQILTWVDSATVVFYQDDDFVDLICCLSKWLTLFSLHKPLDSGDTLMPLPLTARTQTEFNAPASCNYQLWLQRSLLQLLSKRCTVLL